VHLPVLLPLPEPELPPVLLQELLPVLLPERRRLLFHLKRLPDKQYHSL
jgi:hypothetical protein